MSVFHNASFSQNTQLTILKLSEQFMTSYHSIILKQFPNQHFPTDLSCFQIATKTQTQLPNNFVRIKITYLSIDPVMRVWISGAQSYLPSMKLNSPIPGFATGIITQTKSKKFQVGDYIVGVLWWTQQCVVKDTHYIRKVPVIQEDKMHKFLTIYGPTGLTAFMSIKQQILSISKNAWIVVSSAAGSVGVSLIKYLKHFKYNNIIGIAGSDKKCKIMEEMGCKKCINYKTQNLKEAINKMLPEGVDLFYDNVGQQTLQSLLQCMKIGGKIILCGATATYNKWKQKQGVRGIQALIMKRITMKGILYYYKKEGLLEAFMQMISIPIQFPQTVIQGIENCPQVYQDLYNGKFIGKPVVKI